MKSRWIFEVAVTSIGLLVLANCAAGNSTPTPGTGGEGGDDWSGPASSSSSSGNGGSGGSSSSNGGAGGGASSSSSSGGGGCESPCKLVAPQCGCAAGEGCTIDKNGGRMCAAAGSVAVGQECFAPEDCVAGALCLLTSPTNASCYEFCSSDAQCTAPGGLCVITLTDSLQNPIPNLTLCTENCDPSTNTGCPVPTTACRFGREPGGQQRILSLCGEAGLGTLDSTCTTNEDCAATYACISSQCKKVCKVSGGGPACPAGSTCTAITIGADAAEITIGSTQYGACL